MTTFNLVVGDKVQNAVDHNVSIITAIKGRWVEITNGLRTQNVSRADALAARNVWLDANTFDDACKVCGDTATILRNGQVACKTCCNNADLDAVIESDDDILDMGAVDSDDTYTESRSIIDPRKKATYQRIKMADGRSTQNNGDALSEVLLGLSASDLEHLASAMTNQVRAWPHLNVGQRSMNARNVLRNLCKKDPEAFGTISFAVHNMRGQA